MMSCPDPIAKRFARLRYRIKCAERVAGLGIGAIVLASLLRTMHALPNTRVDALYELAVCAATLLGWAFICVGMRLTTQAVIMDMQRATKAKKIKRATPANFKKLSLANDVEPLHRAVWALAHQSKKR